MVGELAGCLPLEPIRGILEIIKSRAVIQETPNLIAPQEVQESISESAKVTIT